MLKLLHYKDSLMFSEIVTCSAIELKFKGKFIGESKLSDDWYIATSTNKIICISFTGDNEVSELFTFQGSFSIVGVKVVTKELQEIEPYYEKLDIDLFGMSRESFENSGSYFQDYDSRHLPIKTIDSTDIYKNNLFTKQDEFYYENGDNYFGAYHQHSNGQAMSESEHTVDSVKIYRKDQNNKLYKPKPKRLRVISKDDDKKPSRDEEKTYRTFQIGGRTTSGEVGAGGSGEGGGGGY